MAQIHELNNAGVPSPGTYFVTDNGTNTGRSSFEDAGKGFFEGYEGSELAGQYQTPKQAIDGLAQQVDDAVEDVAALKTAGSGLTDDAKQALLACFQNVAWVHEQGQSYYNALEDALYPPIRATSITLNTDTVKLQTLGTTQQLTATVLPADATDSVVWTSSDTSVATVVDGLVTSVAYGAASITATAGDVSASASVLVAQAELTGITAVFEQGDAVIYDTASLDDLKPMLTVTASYDDGTTQAVTDYTLSGTLAEGMSTITVTFGGKMATFDVTVSEYVAPDTSAVIKSADMGYGTRGAEVALTGASTTEPMSLSRTHEQTEVSANVYIKYLFPKDSGVSFSATYSKASWLLDNTFVTFSSLTYADASEESPAESQISANTKNGTIDRIAFTLSTAHVDDSYAYERDTGYIIFAGKNTQYYGKTYITD